MRGKLCRVDEDGHHREVAHRLGFLDERKVPLVKCPHRWDHSNRFAFAPSELELSENFLGRWSYLHGVSKQDRFLPFRGTSNR